MGSTLKEFKSNSRECSDCKTVRIHPFKARSLLPALFSLIAGKFIRSELGACIDRLKKERGGSGGIWKGSPWQTGGPPPSQKQRE